MLSEIHRDLDPVWQANLLNQIYAMAPGLTSPIVEAQVPVEVFGNDPGCGSAGIILFITLKTLLAREPSHYQFANFYIQPCSGGETHYTVRFVLRPTGVQDLMEK